MKKEEWKIIDEYPNYMVSNLGRVKSLNYMKSGKEKILKCWVKKDGYIQIRLNKYGKGKKYYVHRLVAEAFIPNPNNLPEVNHKSEIKTQNNVENLEWCDRKYNMNYGTHPKKSKTVLQYDLEGNLIAEFPSLMEIKRQFGYNCGYICNCCNSKLQDNMAYGFKWRYKN